MHHDDNLAYAKFGAFFRQVSCDHLHATATYRCEHDGK